MNRIYVKIPYNRECINAIKGIPTRIWHPDSKQWSVSYNYLTELSNAIRPSFPQVADNILVQNGFKAAESNSFLPTNDTALLQQVTDHLFKIVPPHLTLYPFQIEGIAFISKTKGKVIVGDEPGLGKTITALLWLEMTQAYPALIIVPASLKLNWYKEIGKWIPCHTTNIIWASKDLIQPNQDIYIINYDLLAKKKDELATLNYKTVILDECTYIKEPKAIRSKNAIFLGKRAEYVLALTGTPILNRPSELFNSLNLVDPKRFPKAWAYYKRYCNLFYNSWAWDYRGASNLSELKEKLKPVMIRRLKSDVLKDLPPKRRETIYVELPKELSKVYKDTELELVAALKEFKSWKKSHGLNVENENTAPNHMVLLAKLNYLRQIVGIAKAQQSFETIQSFVDSGKKLVIFGHHLDVLNLLEQYFKNKKIIYVRVDGQTSGNKRQVAVDSFQNDPEIKIFLGSITAIGMGVTLTASSDILFIERVWTPSVEEQAEDRCDRIGASNAVTAWYFTVENTVDHILAQVINNKRKIINQILQGKSEELQESSIINDVFNELTKEDS